MGPGGRRAGPIAFAVAGAIGFLAGVLLVVALLAAGDGGATRTVTVMGTVPPADHTVITRTAVAAVVGERLDVAKERVERGGFLVEVDGGGVFGVMVDANWEVVAQDPPGGAMLERGSTVRLEVERR